MNITNLPAVSRQVCRAAERQLAKSLGPKYPRHAQINGGYFLQRFPARPAKDGTVPLSRQRPVLSHRPPLPITTQLFQKGVLNNKAANLPRF